MSPDAWEQRALDSIRDGLVHSDPELARLLTTFTSLASDEKMPVRENSGRALYGPSTVPATSRGALAGARCAGSACAWASSGLRCCYGS